MCTEKHHLAFSPHFTFIVDTFVHPGQACQFVHLLILVMKGLPINHHTLQFARSHLLLFLGWMRTTTSSLMEWTSRIPFFPTLQRSTACFPVSSSFPTVLLALTFTSTPRSGRLRRTVGYVSHWYEGETYRGGWDNFLSRPLFYSTNIFFWFPEMLVQFYSITQW